MALENRTRSRKVHFWAIPELMHRFDLLRDRLGMTRDGIFERAMAEYVESHKEDQSAAEQTV